MRTANGLFLPSFCALGYGDAWQQEQAVNARNEVLSTGDFRMSVTTEEDRWAVPLAVYIDNVVFVSGHGSGYPREAPNRHDGDRISARGNRGFATTTSVAERYDTANPGSETYAVLADGTTYELDGTRYEEREGMSFLQKTTRCNLLVVAACDSAKSAESIARKLVGGRAVWRALGYDRSMNESLNIVFMQEFWSEFAQEDWGRPHWPTKFRAARGRAEVAFWEHYTPMTAGYQVLFNLCNPTLSHGERFTHMTGDQ